LTPATVATPGTRCLDLEFAIDHRAAQRPALGVVPAWRERPYQPRDRRAHRGQRLVDRGIVAQPNRDRHRDRNVLATDYVDLGCERPTRIEMRVHRFDQRPVRTRVRCVDSTRAIARRSRTPEVPVRPA
jgi:hypothetical protein